MRMNDRGAGRFMENLPKRRALIRISAFVNHDLLFAVTLSHFPGPLQKHDIIQAIRSPVMKVAFVNPAGPHGFTKSIRCFGSKLAGAPLGTMTIGKPLTPNHPWISHPALLSST